MDVMPARTILIIEDEPQIRRVVRNALAEDGDRVVEAGTAREGIDLAAAERPSLVVLDLGLPDAAGISVCREIRKWATMPIIVLSARHSESEKVALLEAGADDYVTKPFSPAELRARVHAQLRRARFSEVSQTEPVVRFADLEIDAGGRVLRRAGEEVHLTVTEWDLLRLLLRNAGRTLTHQQLFRGVWPGSPGDPQQYLRVYVARLRRKLDDPIRPRLILTETGVGYRLVSPD
jgi:two-component system KDP operon response regulator KdpE